MAKKQVAPSPVATSPLSRVYMDISAEKHMAAKLAALQAGMTLKGWMEHAITQVLAQSKKTK